MMIKIVLCLFFIKTQKHKLLVPIQMQVMVVLVFKEPHPCASDEYPQHTHIEN